MIYSHFTSLPSCSFECDGHSKVKKGSKESKLWPPNEVLCMEPTANFLNWFCTSLVRCFKSNYQLCRLVPSHHHSFSLLSIPLSCHLSIYLFLACLTVHQTRSVVPCASWGYLPHRWMLHKGIRRSDAATPVHGFFILLKCTVYFCVKQTTRNLQTINGAFGSH